MRIVTVLTSLGVGGAEKQALAVAERMAKRGHAVAVLVLRPALPEQWPTTLRTIHLQMRKTPFSLFTGLARARQFLREFQPDLLHSHSFHANIFARLLKVLAPRLTVLSTIHNVYEGSWPRMAAYRLTDPLSSRTIAVSEAVARRFTRLKAVPQRKCSVVPNGIDIEEFAPDAARRACMRAGMGISDEDASADFIWLAAGRIAPAKDYPNLLRAFAEAFAANPKTQLWIAGEASRGPSGVSKRDLVGTAAPKGALEMVRWFGLRRDMPALLDAADAFVSASAWEGMPLAVGEAMAMEKPVLATDAGGVSELVGNAGAVVPARNPDALADAMIAVMQQSREERAAKARAARERVAQHFSIDTTTDAWEAQYKEMLA